MNKISVAIIGGGFSGLALAVKLNKNNVKNVAIFEKLDRVGKKILSTGNGRGNLSNENLSLNSYHGENVGFAEYALNKYSKVEMEEFFGELGILLTSENGKIYPAGFQANSICDALRLSLGDTKLYLGEGIQKIEKTNGGYILYGKNQYFCQKVVFAFGGASQSKFGTDGKSFALAKSLNHTIAKLYPCLTTMKATGYQSLKGIKSEVNLALKSSGKEIKSTRGDLLFTQNGVSGNAVFYLSSYICELEKPYLVCEFVPNISENRLIDHLLSKKRVYFNESYEELLNGIVHKQLGRFIVKSITKAQTLKDITTNEIELIAKKVKAFKIEVEPSSNFEESQVTRGGVKTEQVNAVTFESKLNKNLYIIGEALDIDGDCGGYNLHWAFSSAMACAEAICTK